MTLLQVAPLSFTGVYILFILVEFFDLLERLIVSHCGTLGQDIRVQISAVLLRSFKLPKYHCLTKYLQINEIKLEPSSLSAYTGVCAFYPIMGNTIYSFISETWGTG